MTTVAYPVMQDTDEVICCDCDRPLPTGAPYAERLVSMVDDAPVVEIVCVYC